MSDIFDGLAEDDAVRVVIVAGAGSAFCAGFDLSEFADPDSAHQQRLWESSDRFHHTVLRFPLPVVAAVNGAALAGGFDLAVLADLRVAAEEAFFAHVEHTFGDVVYRPLRDLVGGSVARDLVLTGRRINALEALAVLGLVSRVVAADELLDTARAVAADIALAPRGVDPHEGEVHRRRGHRPDPAHPRPLGVGARLRGGCTPRTRPCPRPFGRAGRSSRRERVAGGADGVGGRGSAGAADGGSVAIRDGEVAADKVEVEVHRAGGVGNHR